MKDFETRRSEELKKAKEELERKFELDSEQKKVLKQVAKKVSEIKTKVGEDGRKMGFEEFKTIETTMVKLEDRLLPELRGQQRENRRALLKKKAGKTQDQLTAGIDSQEGDEYWMMLKEHAKIENELLRKISRSVVAHYGVSADTYQGFIEIYLEKEEN